MGVVTISVGPADRYRRNSAIGSGGLHASVRLNLGREQGNVSCPKRSCGYEAKRASEVAPAWQGVTDMAVLNGKGVEFVGKMLQSIGSRLTDEKPSLNADELKKLRELLRGLTTMSQPNNRDWSATPWLANLLSVNLPFGAQVRMGAKSNGLQAISR